jgi:hypothetical protein
VFFQATRRKPIHTRKRASRVIYGPLRRCSCGPTLRIWRGPLLALALAGPAEAQTGTHTNVRVGPNVCVSAGEPYLVHREPGAAASVEEPGTLYVTALVEGPGAEPQRSRVYVTRDGGSSWHVALDTARAASGDLAIATAKGDRVYFAVHNEPGLTVFDSGDAEDRATLALYRSNDAGRTWLGPVRLGPNWDREFLAVDSNVRSRGARVYVAGEGTTAIKGENGVKVVASSDGGRSFSLPVMACKARYQAATSVTPIVLSDGALVVPCNPYHPLPSRDDVEGPARGIVVSSDGGRTFGPFRPVALVHQNPSAAAMLTEQLAGKFLGDWVRNAYSVDPSAGSFRDRIYSVWYEPDSTGHGRIVESWSDDRSRTWTTPVAVAPSPLAVASQGMPEIAVNRQGVVGVAWYDTRDDPTGSTYNVYFAASLDGGQSFLSAVRVSSAASRPNAPGNLRLAVVDASPVKGQAHTYDVYFDSAFGQRPGGGDYGQMAVDADGRFHPMWVDSRSGTWQVYTATVVVEDAGNSSITNFEECSSRTDTWRNVTNQVALEFGTSTWDPSARVQVVPVALRNVSSENIFGPWTISIMSVHDPIWMPFESILSPPVILNSSNGLPGDGATFVYAGDCPSLRPGEATPPLDWRIHFDGPDYGVRWYMRAKVMAGASSNSQSSGSQP